MANYDKIAGYSGRSKIVGQNIRALERRPIVVAPPQSSKPAAEQTGLTSNTPTIEEIAASVPDTSGYIDIGNGELILKEDYEKLSDEDKDYISENGVEAFNNKLQADLTAFQNNNVKLKSGEWITKEGFSKLSEYDKSILSEKGIAGYNTYRLERGNLTDKEWEMKQTNPQLFDLMQRFKDGQARQADPYYQFKLTHIQLADGSWVLRDDYVALPPEMQKELYAGGVETFNEKYKGVEQPAPEYIDPSTAALEALTINIETTPQQLAMAFLSPYQSGSGYDIGAYIQANDASLDSMVEASNKLKAVGFDNMAVEQALKAVIQDSEFNVQTAPVVVAPRVGGHEVIEELIPYTNLTGTQVDAVKYFVENGINPDTTSVLQQRFMYTANGDTIVKDAADYAVTLKAVQTYGNNLSQYIRDNPIKGEADLTKLGYKQDVIQKAVEVSKLAPSLDDFVNVKLAQIDTRYNLDYYNQLKKQQAPAYDGKRTAQEVEDYLTIQRTLPEIGDEYRNKYGDAAALGSIVSTPATFVLGPAARVIRPDVVWDDISTEEKVLSAAIIATIGMGALSSVAKGAAFTVAKTIVDAGATGLFVADEIKNLPQMTTPQIVIATGVNLLMMGNLLRDVSKIASSKVVAGQLVSNKTVSVLKQWLGDGDVFKAVKYQELGEAIAKGDITAVRNITRDIKAMGGILSLDPNSVVAATGRDMVKMAEYFDKNALTLYKNIDTFRSGELAGINNQSEIYKALNSLVKEQRISQMRAVPFSDEIRKGFELTISEETRFNNLRNIIENDLRDSRVQTSLNPEQKRTISGNLNNNKLSYNPYAQSSRIDYAREIALDLDEAVNNIKNSIKGKGIYSENIIKGLVDNYADTQLREMYYGSVKGQAIVNKYIKDLLKNSELEIVLQKIGGSQFTATGRIITDIKNTIGGQGWQAALDKFGAAQMSAFEPKALEYAKLEVATMKSQYPANMASRGVAAAKAAEFSRQIIEAGGIPAGVPKNYQINANIEGYTVDQWLHDIAEFKSPTYQIQDGYMTVKITPSKADLAIWADKYGGKLPIKLSDGSIIINFKSLEEINHIIKMSKYGEVLAPLEPIPTIMSENPLAQILNDIKDNAIMVGKKYKIDIPISTGLDGIENLSPLIEETRAVKDLMSKINKASSKYGDVTAYQETGMLMGVPRLVKTGKTIEEIAEQIYQDIRLTVDNDGYVAAMRKYGKMLVKDVYPNAIDSALSEISGDNPFNIFNLPDLQIDSTPIMEIKPIDIRPDVFTSKSIDDVIRNIIQNGRPSRATIPFAPITQSVTGAISKGGVAVEPYTTDISNMLPQQATGILTQPIIEPLPVMQLQEIAATIGMAQATIENAAASNQLASNIVSQDNFAALSNSVKESVIQSAVAEQLKAAQIGQAVPSDIVQNVLKQSIAMQPLNMSASQLQSQTKAEIAAQPVVKTDNVIQQVNEQIANPIPVINTIPIPTTISTRIKRNIPIIPPPIGVGTDDADARKNQFIGAVAFKAGMGYWAYKAPYRTDNNGEILDDDKQFFMENDLPAGIIKVGKGEGSGYESIQQFIDDHRLTQFTDRVGFIKISVDEPDKQPGKMGAIEFKRLSISNNAAQSSQRSARKKDKDKPKKKPKIIISRPGRWA